MGVLSLLVDGRYRLLGYSWGGVLYTQPSYLTGVHSISQSSLTGRALHIKHLSVIIYHGAFLTRRSISHIYNPMCFQSIHNTFKTVQGYIQKGGLKHPARLGASSPAITGLQSSSTFQHRIPCRRLIQIMGLVSRYVNPTGQHSNISKGMSGLIEAHRLIPPP